MSPPRSHYRRLIAAIEGIQASNVLASEGALTEEQHDRNVDDCERLLRMSLDAIIDERILDAVIGEEQ